MADRKRVIEALRSAADNEIERLNAAWNKCSADKHRLLKEVRALDAEVARLQAREQELEALLQALYEALEALVLAEEAAGSDGREADRRRAAIAALRKARGET